LDAIDQLLAQLGVGHRDECGLAFDEASRRSGWASS
jgi:hypothetical protein